MQTHTHTHSLHTKAKKKSISYAMFIVQLATLEILKDDKMIKRSCFMWLRKFYRLLGQLQAHTHTHRHSVVSLRMCNPFIIILRKCYARFFIDQWQFIVSDSDVLFIFDIHLTQTTTTMYWLWFYFNLDLNDSVAETNHTTWHSIYAKTCRGYKNVESQNHG